MLEELSQGSVVELDRTLINVIRSNTTDFDVRGRLPPTDLDGDPTWTRYSEGSDYTVENPVAANIVATLDPKTQQPYQIRRTPESRIPEGGEVFVSYDFLPGQVDQQGSSEAPAAFGEPLYYDFMDEVSAVLTALACLGLLTRSAVRVAQFQAVLD